MKIQMIDLEYNVKAHYVDSKFMGYHICQYVKPVLVLYLRDYDFDIDALEAHAFAVTKLLNSDI